MKRFIAVLAVVLGVATASVGAAQATTIGDGPKPTATFCIGGVTTTVTNPLQILIDTIAANNGGVLYTIVFVPPHGLAIVANSITKGACPVRETGRSAGVNRSGTCVNGVFTDLTTDEFGYGATGVATPANWVEGLGETCDDPIALGYKAAGYDVSDSGTVDEAAPQFNVYPYFVKA